MYTLNINPYCKFVFHIFENIVGEGENTGYQHFLLFQQGFQKDFHP